MKKRILLITVAGLSSRFSESIGHPVIKCLYYEKGFYESLLYRILENEGLFSEIIIVGGYGFEELSKTIKEKFASLMDKITLVDNECYEKYGSGYSFYKGILPLKGMDYDEVVFAEGDLFLDKESFAKVCESSKNIMTYSFDPVLSNKSVAYYIDEADKPHYIYDTGHALLSIDEPFKAIYNSGQVWKFANRNDFENLVLSMPEEDFFGTNLVPVNKYFQAVSDIEYVGFKQWINCNTVEDFRKSLEE